MVEHARYKYLVHLDGATYSSRLMKLLLLNSVLVKQRSHVYEFFYDAMVPGQHYLEFEYALCDTDPSSDLVRKVSWAQQHDAEVRDIASRGRAFALRHLALPAVMCYWRELVTQLATRLLRPRVIARPRAHPRGGLMRAHALGPKLIDMVQDFSPILQSNGQTFD